MLELGIVARYACLLQNEGDQASGDAVTFAFHRGPIFPDPHVHQPTKTPTLPPPGERGQPPATISLLLAENFVGDCLLLFGLQESRQFGGSP